MQATGFGTDGVVGTLEAVSRLQAVRVDAEAGLLELAAVFRRPARPESLAGSLRESDGLLSGVERGVRVGGVGTPVVAEFAFAELGARLQMSPFSARRFVADAVDVRHRLPLIWARVRERRVRVSNVRLVAARTRHLSVEAAAYVDAAMVQFAPRSRSSAHGLAGFYVRSTVGLVARFEATVAFLADALAAFGDGEAEELRRVKAVAVLANPARAVELLAAFAALRARSVHVPPDAPLDLHIPEEPPEDRGPESGADGSGGLEGSAGEPDALARVDRFTRRVGFTPTRLPAWLAARTHPRTDIEADGTGPGTVADPEADPAADAVAVAVTENGSTGAVGRPGFVFDWSELLPPLTLYLHLSAEDLRRDQAGTGAGVVRWEGEGPVTHRFVHERLRPLHRYLIAPVVDLLHQAPVDAYEVPDRLRRAVHLRTPADTFPYSSNLSRRVDLDHTEPYQRAPAPPSRGERAWSTRMGNLAPLGRHAHRIKTHGRWTVRAPFEGIYLWRDPHGRLYLVDHTGTHPVGTHPVGAATAHDPDLDVWPADTVVRADFGDPG